MQPEPLESTDVETLSQDVEKLFDAKPSNYTQTDFRLFQRFKTALNSGEVRAAEPDENAKNGWRVNEWVKKGILLGFRMGVVIDMSIDRTRQPWFDKDTWPARRFGHGEKVRIVPGGSSVRDGCFLSECVTCMPPMFINVGTWIGANSMIDSHVLVGSCAQIGANCHISAATQIGGVLEPINALPVIIEDDVLVGGNCGIYEGTMVKKRAVLGTGTILNRSTPVYDLVKGEIYSAAEDEPLVIPENAVVVAGSRAIPHGRGQEWGLSIYTPVIVKYRDSKTDTKIRLESLLR